MGRDPFSRGRTEQRPAGETHRQGAANGWRKNEKAPRRLAQQHRTPLSRSREPHAALSGIGSQTMGGTALILGCLKAGPDP